MHLAKALLRLRFLSPYIHRSVGSSASSAVRYRLLAAKSDGDTIPSLLVVDGDGDTGCRCVGIWLPSLCILSRIKPWSCLSTRPCPVCRLRHLDGPVGRWAVVSGQGCAGPGQAECFPSPPSLPSDRTCMVHEERKESVKKCAIRTSTMALGVFGREAESAEKAGCGVF